MTGNSRKAVEAIAEHPAYGRPHGRPRRRATAVARGRRTSRGARLWINGEELQPRRRFAHLDHVYD